MPTTGAVVPAAVKALPRCTERGVPVPFSSGTDDDGRGKFGSNDTIAVMLCAMRGLCGVCGTAIGDGPPAFLVLDTRPLDLAVLAFADPPNHEACALWAMRACPFIVSPDGARSDGTVKRGWLLIIAASCSPGPPPPGSKGLVGFVPGPVERIRVFAYDDGKLAEATPPPRLLTVVRTQPRRRPRSKR